MHNVKITCVLIAVVSVMASGAELGHHPKSETINFRIAAIAHPVRKSSFSPNREALLVSLTDKTNSSGLAKIVFRYIGYEDGVPEEFVDYDLVHTFKGLRDRSCDETWHSFSTKMEVMPGDKVVISEAVRFASADAIQDIPAGQLLPCYVVQSGGYKGSRRVAAERSEVSRVEGQ